MKNRKFQTFLLRLLLVYSLHLIVKWGDETFHGFFDFTWRGIYFSIFFVGLWVSALYLFDWIKQKWFTPRRSTLVYLFAHLCYAYVFAFLTNAVYLLADSHIYNNAAAWKDIGYSNPMLIFGLVIIYMSATCFYEYFQTEIAARENQLLAEKLKKENAIAHYKLLKAQVEPHFLFNSLSVLSSIVHKDADQASDYIVKLSRMLRFTIDQNDKMFVTLTEELAFTENYFYLIQTRFGKALQLVNQLHIADPDSVLMPPAALQILIENVVRHNKYSDSRPLEIKLENDDDFIYVSNALNLKENPDVSTGTGLSNLSKRFSLLTDRMIVYRILDQKYVVSIPIIKNSKNDESTGI